MERLKYLLIGLVVVLAAAVVYGYVDGSGDDGDPVSAPAAVERPGADGEPAGTRESEPPESPRAARGADAQPGRADAASRRAEARRLARSEAARRAARSRVAREAARARRQSAARSRAAFIVRGNAICRELPRKMREQVERVQREAVEGGEPPDPQTLVRSAGAPVLREAASDFEAAVPPGDAGARAIAAAVAASARGFETATSAVSPEGLQALVEFQRLARRYGLNSCRGF